MNIDEQPLTRKEGLELLRFVKEVNTRLQRLNRAVFGDEKPIKKEDGEIDEFEKFGYEIGRASARTDAEIAKLEAAIRGGANHGGK